MSNDKDLECPKTKGQIFDNFEESRDFCFEFMMWIEQGLLDKESHLDELQEVCQEYKGFYFISPGGNYIVSLGSTWEGLRI